MGCAINLVEEFDQPISLAFFGIHNRTEYGYDNNGNLIFKNPKIANLKAFSYSYSSKNQLTEVKEMDAPFGELKKHTLYKYDVVGRRMEKRIVDYRQNPTAISARRYVYDGDNIYLEFDGGNTLVASHTHTSMAADDILSTFVTPAGVSAGLAQSSGAYYYTKDALGTVTDVLNNQGDVIQRYEYSAFGKLNSVKDQNGIDISSAAVLKPYFTFTGRELDDESGMYYYRARYYDSSIGRFIQKDPHPGKVENSITVINQYCYVGNLPTNIVDPSGKFWVGLFYFIIKAGAIAVGSAAGVSGLSYWANGNRSLDSFMEGISFYFSDSRRVANTFAAGVAVALIGSWANDSFFDGFKNFVYLKSAANLVFLSRVLPIERFSDLEHMLLIYISIYLPIYTESPENYEYE